MSWKDRTYRYSDETQSFPFIQWVNQGNSLEPRMEKGGFACPLDQALPIPGVAAEIHHRNGKTTDVIYTPELTVAVIATRFAWIKDGLRLPSYRKGARGKLQALCYVQTVDGEPALAMLTFTGLAGRSFSEARKAFADSVRKATEGKAPSWAFWMTLHAGNVEMVGSQQQSPITTVELAREVDPDRDYVGDALADAIEALLDDEVPRWKAAWSTGGPNGEGEIEDAEENGLPERAESRWLTVRLPFRSRRYGANASVADLYNANDVDALKALIAWCGDQPQYGEVRAAAEEALEALEIPF